MYESFSSYLSLHNQNNIFDYKKKNNLKYTHKKKEEAIVLIVNVEQRDANYVLYFFNINP
jgi:hypothetical protein